MNTTIIVIGFFFAVCTLGALIIAHHQFKKARKSFHEDEEYNRYHGLWAILFGFISLLCGCAAFFMLTLPLVTL